MKRPRVLLADDHAIVLDGLRRILGEDFDLVGTVTDGHALVEAAQRLRPDVIVTDISMPLLNGLDAVRKLGQKDSRGKVVFLTMHADVDFAVEAMRVGAAGYILKHAAGDELTNAIREVLDGRTYVSPGIAKDVTRALEDRSAADARRSVRLTPREREVLQLVAEGRKMSDIATILEISSRTVEFHKYNLMDKLGLRTTAELTQYAVKHGVVSP